MKRYDNGPFSGSSPTMSASYCLCCERWRGRGTCDAFPDGVPMEIRLNRVDHREPYPGDGGLRYKGSEECIERELRATRRFLGEEE